jgi:hypothetical protein
MKDEIFLFIYLLKDQNQSSIFIYLFIFDDHEPLSHFLRQKLGGFESISDNRYRIT